MNTPTYTLDLRESIATLSNARRAEVWEIVGKLLQERAEMLEALKAVAPYLARLPQTPDRGHDVAALTQQVSAVLAKVTP